MTDPLESLINAADSYISAINTLQEDDAKKNFDIAVEIYKAFLQNNILGSDQELNDSIG